MFIDIHVFPAFYEPINGDPAKEELRHRALNIHKNGTAPLKHIFNQMNCAGLDRLCLLPQDYTSRTGSPLVTNDEIRTLVDLAPDHFIGFASVDPNEKDAADRLEDAFARLDLRGLYLHPGRQRFFPADPCAEPLYRICEQYDRPVLFHAGFSYEPDTVTRYGHPLAFEEIAEQHPKLRICVSQFGWPWCRETAMLMLKYPNIYTDTACLYFDSASEFYKQMLTQDVPITWIDRSLRHQIMFGSANPRFEQIRMANSLSTLDFRDSTLDLIRGGNALAFLGRKF
ncbi:MAG: amidohydrolase family protein [Clostridia bacterium]|nr:amidohydrolase family protein [Clostridia bacterium]MBQ6475794.1 amidohydrolase family protein [Clostridia bacterium]MBR0445030.1 amidohydrolase family protein [Clostridia bacterium]MCR5073946.1 amidohydrolase family protein [Clostridiales bacterium]